jgi:dTDP-4-amino-4,6-dideoxygalactose transaminase
MAYKIPLFDLNFDDSEEKAVIETLRSKWISIGPKSQEFESAFAELFEVKNAVSLANCTAALHLALLALKIGPNDEVLCPSLSFAATANCIKYVGATPVFCDIMSLMNPTISSDEIKQKTTSKTKAIIVMHYAGYSCNMDEIMSFAKTNGLKVIEDACHAPLSEYKGQKLGTIGDIGCFSFFSNKNISTGEGGMIITNDDTICASLKLLRSHGMTSMSYERSKGHATAYDIVELGYNFRMDDIRSSIGIVQLKKLLPDLKKRAIIRKCYLELLKEEKRILIPFENENEFSSNYIFPIVIKDPNKRDLVREKLHNSGIQTSVHYPPIHRFTIYETEYIELPITDLFAASTLTLPMYGTLTSADIEFIVSTLIYSLDDC